MNALASLQVDALLSYAIAIVIPALDAILPVLPSETAIIALGVATAGSADPRIGLLVAFSAAGAFLGDNLCYLLGRRFGPRIERRFFRGEKGARRLAWAERSLERYGMPLIVVCRFIPGGRTAVTLCCGIVRYQQRRFVIATAIAGVIWASYSFFIGRLGGQAFEDKPWAGLLLALGIAVAISALIELIRRFRSGRARRRTPAPEPAAPAPAAPCPAGHREPRSAEPWRDGAAGVIVCHCTPYDGYFDPRSWLGAPGRRQGVTPDRLRPMTPARTRPIETSLRVDTVSPRKAMPMTAVPRRRSRSTRHRRPPPRGGAAPWSAARSSAARTRRRRPSARAGSSRDSSSAPPQSRSRTGGGENRQPCHRVASLVMALFYAAEKESRCAGDGARMEAGQLVRQSARKASDGGSCAVKNEPSWQPGPRATTAPGGSTRASAWTPG